LYLYTKQITINHLKQADMKTKDQISTELTIEQIRAMEPGRAKMEAYEAYKNAGKGRQRFTSKIRKPYIHK
jgi:hypothetical protein